VGVSFGYKAVLSTSNHVNNWFVHANDFRGGKIICVDKVSTLSRTTQS